MNKPILGWHFVPTSRLLFDGQLARAGRSYRLPDGVEPILCRRGYHASRRAIDALAYAPGPIVCRVKLRGTVIEAEDKLVASERQVIWLADATSVLHHFRAWCAERALARSAGHPIEPYLHEVLQLSDDQFVWDAVLVAHTVRTVREAARCGISYSAMNRKLTNLLLGLAPAAEAPG